MPWNPNIALRTSLVTILLHFFISGVRVVTKFLTSAESDCIPAIPKGVEKIKKRDRNKTRIDKTEVGMLERNEVEKKRIGSRKDIGVSRYVEKDLMNKSKIELEDKSAWRQQWQP